MKYMNFKTKRIVTASLIAAFCCVATILIKIPTPPFGYINAGDVIVLIAGLLLSPFYGFFAAALGSCVADMFLGYFVYAPVTFFIKGLMAVIAHYIYKGAKKKLNNKVSKIIAVLPAEIFMVLGYYLFEGFLYGFIPSLVNIPLNCIQGFFAIIMGTLIANILEKYKIQL